jgi:hypothetical protein
MSFYDGLQTFRAMEYSVTADPQSQKVYRLQTLSENGFPEIQVIGVDSLDGVFFEDKTPYDNNFTDNSTPFLSGEAVQLFAGVQKVMKTLDDRFQWKGIDGTGTIPVQLIMQNSDKSSLFFNSYAYYDVEDHYFVFGKSIQNATPLWCAVDLVAHEFIQAHAQSFALLMKDSQMYLVSTSKIKFCKRHHKTTTGSWESRLFNRYRI